MEAENYWVGKPKQRYDFVLKYLGGNETSRGYTVHKFEDRMGRKLLTYSDYKPESIEVSWDVSADTLSNDTIIRKLKSGDCFTCKATVIRHDINNFKVDIPYKETVLNRAVFGDYLGKVGETG